MINIGVTEFINDIDIGVTEFINDIDLRSSIDVDNTFIIDYEIQVNEKEIEKLTKDIELLKNEISEYDKEDKVYNEIICYYINLERRKDRKEHIEGQLDLLKEYFKYECYKGVDAREINMQEYIDKKLILPNPSYHQEKFVVGQLACMLSHLGSWKKFLESKYQYLLILEDDAVVNKSYFDFLFPKIMENIKNLDFDWLYLGRQCLGYKNFYEGDIEHNVFYKPVHTGTGNHSYILSRQGAKNLVRYLEKSKGNYVYPCCPLDRWDMHSKYYYSSMLKYIKMYSIIPKNFIEKRQTHKGKAVFDKSKDFLFYAKDWSDSDTSRPFRKR